MIVVILIKKIIALFLIMGMGILLVKCRILRLQIQMQSGPHTVNINVDTIAIPADPAIIIHSGRTTAIVARRAEPPTCCFFFININS